MLRRQAYLLVATICTAVPLAVPSVGAEDAAPPTAEQLRFFEQEVRPLLAQRCFKCHGEEKQNGNLRLDGLGTILAGGDSGPAIVAGKPDESLLVEAINRRSLEMPPDESLPDEEIAVLTRWIEIGAPWPGGDRDAIARPAARITAEDRQFWSFQPLRDPPVPDVAVQGWGRNEIDRFIARKLHEHNLAPSGEARPESLLRRLYQTAIGLPPAPDEIDAFLSDDSLDAYEDLVDRLLDSPRYGEHWAAMWLDLVRYAESDGYKADHYRPHAWRYRDYVIRAFNGDMPYDRFVLEQLAGDEVAPHDPDALAATGYLRHGIYEYNQRDAPGQWRDMLNDVTDNVADTFLALGMGCARCHDHKFDPLLQKDYFRLQSFFVNLSLRDDVPLGTHEQLADYEQKLTAWKDAAADVLAQIEEIEGRRLKKAERAAVGKFPREIRDIMAKPESERDPYEKQLAYLVWLQVLGDEGQNASKLSKEDQSRWDALQQELKQFDHLKPPPLPLGRLAGDVGPVAPAVFIPGRERLGEVLPGFLSVLDEAPAVIEPAPAAPNSTGRRTALARWLIRPDHPLTSRVIVNRIWQHHFGTGLVATPSDFGRLGEAPSHAELLDWLAVRFMEHGWSIKWLQREVLTSATFRQSSRSDDPDARSVRVAPASANAMQVDPANRLLWRFPVRRLSAEQIRDAMLAVSGELELEGGGPGVDFQQPRRSVYTKALRNARDPLLDAFDQPDRILGTGERNVTTSPTQSLLMINGDWVLARATALARRLEREIAGADDSRVRLACRLVYGRDPSAMELDRATRFVLARREAARSARAAEEQGDPALADLAHVLLNSNEFLYVD